MGVYNPFAELPNSCVLCDSKEKCDLHREYAGRSVGRHKDCPLIEVKSKGRLIDEQVFIENAVKYSRQSLKTIGEALSATPTVIEAEGNDG